MKVGRLHPSSLGPLQALGATMPRLIEAQLSAVHLSYGWKEDSIGIHRPQHLQTRV